MLKLKLLTICLITSSISFAQWQPKGPTGMPVGNFIAKGNIIFASSGIGVYKSTDVGSTWLPANNGITTAGVNCFTISGNDLFLTTSLGIFASNDNGDNWNPVSDGLPKDSLSPGAPPATGAILSSGNSIFVATNTSIFITGDKGKNWKKITKGIPSPDTVQCKNFVEYKGNIFAATNKGVFLYSYNDSSWIAVNKGLPTSYAQYLYSLGDSLICGSVPNSRIYVLKDTISGWVFKHTIGEIITALFVKDNLVLAGTTSGLYYSTAGWKGLSTSVPDLKNTKIYYLWAYGKTLFAGTEDGIYKTTDNGLSWMLSNSGMKGRNITSVAFLGKKNFAVNSNTGVIMSDDGGITWAKKNKGFSVLPGSNLLASDIGMFITTSDGVYASQDSAESWTKANDGLRYKSIARFAKEGITVYAGATDGTIYKSVNRGVLWTVIDSTTFRFKSIGALLVNNSEIYVGVQGAGLYRSIDNGANWIYSGDSLSKNIQSITQNSTHLFTLTDNGLFSSTNKAQTWTRTANAGLTSGPSSICVRGNLLFGTTTNGIFVSENNGASWTDISEGYPANLPIWSLTGSQTHLIAINFYGLWTRPFTEITSIQSPLGETSGCRIYPNPTEDGFNLELTLASYKDVSITMTNMLGEKVYAHAPEKVSGFFGTSISTAGFAPGVYYVKITTGDATATYKVVVK